MHFNSDTDKYTLSTGRTFYSHCGVLGLSPSADTLSEGFDGGLYSRDINGDPTLIPGERQEIATEMIRRWTKWASLAPLYVAAFTAREAEVCRDALEGFFDARINISPEEQSAKDSVEEKVASIVRLAAQNH